MIDSINGDPLAQLARAAFSVGLSRHGVFFSQLRLFLLRLERGLDVSESDWLNLAEYAFSQETNCEGKSG